MKFTEKRILNAGACWIGDGTFGFEEKGVAIILQQNPIPFEILFTLKELRYLIKLAKSQGKGGM